MGFMRKGLFVATGGASGMAGLKANSKKERTAKAMEQQVRLQKQMLKQQSVQAPARPQPPAIANLETRPWLVIFGYSEGKEIVGTDFTRLAKRFASEEDARQWAAKQQRVRTPVDGKQPVSGYSVLRSSLDGPWRLTLTLEDGTTVAAGRFGSKEEALRVVKASWKVFVNNKTLTVKSGRAEPVQAQRPAVAARPVPARVDPMEQLRKLGELRDSGVLTTEEFDTKKAELLRRV